MEVNPNRFAVTPARLAKAQHLIAEKAPALGEMPLIDLLVELHFDDETTFNERGGIDMDLTDLQTVALAAAVLAVSETGGAMQEMQTEEGDEFA